MSKILSETGWEASMMYCRKELAVYPFEETARPVAGKGASKGDVIPSS